MTRSRLIKTWHLESGVGFHDYEMQEFSQLITWFHLEIGWVFSVEFPSNMLNIGLVDWCNLPVLGNHLKFASCFEVEFFL